MLFKKKLKTEIYIDGMHCMHCAKAVENALKDIKGISSARVELENKKAIVASSDETDFDEVRQAIAELGFSVVDIVKL